METYINYLTNLSDQQLLQEANKMIKKKDNQKLRLIRIVAYARQCIRERIN